eukprot:537748-Hanusia_phi.AAC.2
MDKLDLRRCYHRERSCSTHPRNSRHTYRKGYSEPGGRGNVKGYRERCPRGSDSLSGSGGLPAGSNMEPLRQDDTCIANKCRQGRFRGEIM